MGDFIIITLMVSSFWLLWEIIRVVSMEWLNRDEITLPAGELGRSELLRCADSFEQLSGMFQGMVTKKEELSGQDMDEVLFRVQTSVCRSCSAAQQAVQRRRPFVKCVLHPFHAVSSALRLEVVWEFLPGNMQKESAHLTR